MSSAINWDSGGFFFSILLDFYRFFTAVFGLGLIVGIVFSVAVDALNSFQAVSLTRLSQVPTMCLSFVNIRSYVQHVTMLSES